MKRFGALHCHVEEASNSATYIQSKLQPQSWLGEKGWGLWKGGSKVVGLKSTMFWKSGPK